MVLCCKASNHLVSSRRSFGRGQLSWAKEVTSFVMAKPCHVLALDAATYAMPSFFTVMSAVTCESVFPWAPWLVIAKASWMGSWCLMAKIENDELVRGLCMLALILLVMVVIGK